MKKMLLNLWQMPQTALGMLLVALLGKSHVIVTDGDVRVVFSQKMKGGISLGQVVVVNSCIFRRSVEESLSKLSVRHALGHCAQSRLLGWLYLPLIGLPSIIWSGVFQILQKRNPNLRDREYYRFFTEKWADRIAGITRK